MFVLPIVILSLSLWVQTLLFKEDRPDRSGHPPSLVEGMVVDGKVVDGEARPGLPAQGPAVDTGPKIADVSGAGTDSADSEVDQ